MRQANPRSSLANEEGLTLVELLAGLLLFSMVLAMLYGVLMSGYSLKNKVTSQATMRNHADALANSIITSTRNAYGIENVTDYMTAPPNTTVGRQTKTAEASAVISAIWLTQLVNPGQPDQHWVNTLYKIEQDGAPRPGEHTHYRLVRETFTQPPGQNYLPFPATKYFTSKENGGKDPDPGSTIQLNDPRFPLLNDVKVSDAEGNNHVQQSFVKPDYNDKFERSLEISLVLCEYDPDRGQESLPYEFRSRIHIESLRGIFYAQ
ncbi:hypothetical protein G3578_03940 [Brevibacillus sp. SYP-B805]|uniref:hypothetical protein n=1 Tax=Brevibacillus sp. SYP-B805 TaxID=1578199 RepID=UPI0013E9FEC0|nr:hypothetical protein [Brevibacillus sp. SYP-B805]NGQ94326.1 hypothetical protein [Brevibacillus sp. SYP-B805]